MTQEISPVKTCHYKKNSCVIPQIKHISHPSQKGSKMGAYLYNYTKRAFSQKTNGHTHRNKHPFYFLLFLNDNINIHFGICFDHLGNEEKIAV